MADEKTQQEMQEKLMLFQTFQAQLEQLSNQASLVESRNIEIEAAEDALNEISKTKEESEMLVPLGAGCYGYGKLADKENFMVEIGAGLAQKKDLRGSIDAINQKKHEIDDIRKKIDHHMNEMRAGMDKVGLELQQISAAAEKNNDKDEDDSITVE